MKQWILAAAMALAGSSAMAACDPGETVVRFSHIVPASGHPKGEAAERLAARVNAEMNGALCMTVHPDAGLFGDETVMEALLRGDAELAAPSLARLDPYTKEFRLFDLPFLFRDFAALDRFTASPAGAELLHAADAAGFAGLAYWSGGLRQFSADRPLVLPADAKGLRFRIQPSDVSEAMIAALGATSVRLNLSEVFAALESRRVDAQENSWSNIYTQKFYAVQDGITETNHQVLSYLLVASRKFIDGLEPAVRERFLAIVAEVTAEANAQVESIEAASRQKIAGAGETIRTLTPDERAAWVAAMQPVWDRFRGEIGAGLIEAAVAANGG